jgi:hypothetical protein
VVTPTTVPKWARWGPPLDPGDMVQVSPHSRGALGPGWLVPAQWIMRDTTSTTVREVLHEAVRGSSDGKSTLS